jgi:hypothetical protein
MPHIPKNTSPPAISRNNNTNDTHQQLQGKTTLTLDLFPTISTQPLLFESPDIRNRNGTRSIPLSLPSNGTQYLYQPSQGKYCSYFGTSNPPLVLY